MMENASIKEFTKNRDTELVAAFHLFNQYTQRLEEATISSKVGLKRLTEKWHIRIDV